MKKLHARQVFERLYPTAVADIDSPPSFCNSKAAIITVSIYQPTNNCKCYQNSESKGPKSKRASHPHQLSNSFWHFPLYWIRAVPLDESCHRLHVARAAKATKNSVDFLFTPLSAKQVNALPKKSLKHDHCGWRQRTFFPLPFRGSDRP